MSKTVSDQLVSMLRDAGIKRIYGIVGDSLNPVTEALTRDGSIRWIHVRHEEAAAFAASAEAQITGEIAACCGSSGPGNMHLINGLYDAARSDAPVFAISSHIPLSQVGNDYFQETHPQEFYRECTAYCELVSEAEHAATITANAIRHAKDKPGVGMIVLPGDVASQKAEREGYAKAPLCVGRATVTPSPDDIQALADLINGSRRITFFCGYGCTGAQKEIVELAAKIKAPIAYTFRAKDIMEQDNPYAVGMTGLLGWGDATQAMNDCDLLVMWGTDFPYSAFLPHHVKVAQVDVNATHLGRRVPAFLGVQGETLATLRELAPLIKEKSDDEHLSQSLTRHAKEMKKLNAYIHHVDEDAPIRPEYITKIISDCASDSAIFTVDTGTPNIWSARYLHGGGTRRIIGSFKHGSMACALAMAMGAQAPDRERQVIALCGDGGLAMLPGDLLTLVQEGLPVKVLVYNNSALDFINLEMTAAGIRPVNTDLKNPSFAEVAQAMGVQAERLTKPGDAILAVKRWLACEGPALLDVVVDEHALAMPPEITMNQAFGFAKTIAKHVLHGELNTVKRILFGNRRLFF